MTTDPEHQHRAAIPRGSRRGGRTNRFVWASSTVLVLSGVLLTNGASAAPLTAAAPVVQVAAAAPCVPKDVVDLQPVSYWEQRFLETWDLEYETDLPASRSVDSWDHYELGYAIDASTAIFRATGNTTYLDRALEYVVNVVATARVSSSLPTSQYRDDYLGWISNRADLDPSGVEVPLYESYFWRYATTMLRVMRDTPAVYDDPSYRTQYDRLLDFAEVNIFQKWYARGADDSIYRSRTHLAAHWAMIALNLSLLTADAGRQFRYREVVDTIDAALRNQLRPNPVDPSAYFWNAEWGSDQRPGQDVGHGNGVVSYVVEARDRGGHWTATDMAAFSALLTKVIWPGGQSYADYVDGSGTGNGWISDGFVKLGRYDAAVQRRLDESGNGGAQFSANMALNAKILS